MVSSARFKRKQLNLMTRLNTPMYFGYRVTQLTKDLENDSNFEQEAAETQVQEPQFVETKKLPNLGSQRLPAFTSFEEARALPTSGGHDVPRKRRAKGSTGKRSTGVDRGDGKPAAQGRVRPKGPSRQKGQTAE